MTPLGVVEVAELLGVKRQTVSVWRRRGVFLEPDGHISGVDWWRKDRVLRWAQKSGRAKDPSITETP